LLRLPDGRVAYSLKKTWRDGSTHVVLSPQVLIERLLALVPRPRRHLVTYHGVLAPGASLRHRVVAQVDEDVDGVHPSQQLGPRVVATPVHDLQATILHQMGLDHERLTYRYQGRRFRLTDVHGNVIGRLLA
jgi:hypothetical protein